MARTPIIAANWKMNKSIGEAVSYIKELKGLVKNTKDKEIVICPPFTALSAVSAELKASEIRLGAQNLFHEESGAFTGEISPLMLKETNCKYVILGHSERRKYFNETDEIVNKKIKIALKNKLIPILCIGETLEQRKANKTKEIIKKQFENSLKNIKSDKLVIAYEPVWAIGTGNNATPEQAEEAHAFIRRLVKKHFGSAAAEKIRIIYGGSVIPENIKGLMSQKNIDGALVGGASLDAKEFFEIIDF